MSKTARGYTTLFLRKVEEADQSLPVIQFANECIRRGIPIVEVASRLGVTRASVYNWFTGATVPRRQQSEQIKKTLARWKRA